MDIKTLMRLSHVRRWHIVQVDREQSVAEHSARVQLLAVELATASGMDPVQVFKTMRWALWHDVPEIVIGDLPTPTKKAVNCEELERAASSTYREILTLTPPDVQMIVKIADLIEAALYLEEHGRGEHAREVYLGVVVDLHALVDSTDEFGPAARACMDEVLNGWN
jgi:5'-deoxynucleotidase